MDGAVVELSAELVSCHDEQDRITMPFRDILPWKRPKGVQLRIMELQRQFDELRDGLGNTPATTIDGFRAKARALLLWLAPEGVRCTENNPDYLLAWSLCCDLLEVPEENPNV